jgi:hypothetical protein
MSRYHKRRRFQIELLEPRLAMHSEIIVSTPGGVGIFNNYQGQMPLNGLFANDLVEISGTLAATRGGGNAWMDVYVDPSDSNPVVRIDDIVGGGGSSGSGKTRIISSGNASLRFSIFRSWGVEDEQYGQISVKITRATDIAPLQMAPDLANRRLVLGVDIRNAPLDVTVPIRFDWLDSQGVPVGTLQLQQGHPSTFISPGPITTSSPGIEKYIDFKDLNPPINAVALRATIDPDNLVKEANESNSVVYRLANIIALPPVITGKGASVGYRVENPPFINPAGTNPVTVQAWWSKSANFKGVIGKTPVFKREMIPTQGTDRYEEIPASVFATQPAEAKYLLTRVDNASLIPEANEDDNVAALGLFQAEITELKWDNKGNVRFEVNVTNSKSIPANSNFRAEFAWSNSATGETTMRRGSFTFPISRGRSFRDGKNAWTIPAKDLSPPSQELIRRFGAPITHLLATVKYDGDPSVVESKPRSLVLPQVSLELSDAPGASTVSQRVQLWLEKHRDAILKEAKSRNIPPRAIAAAIAWEAMENIQSVADFGLMFRRVHGPGKVHAVRSTLGDLFRPDPFPMVSEEVEYMGYFKVTDESTRSKIIQTPEGAIQYIAAIMDAYASAFEVAGYPEVRLDVGILTTLYHGPEVYKNLSTTFDRMPDFATWGASPKTPRAAEGDPKKLMGAWVNSAQGKAFLNRAIPSDATPKPTAIKFRPVTVPVSITFPESSAVVSLNSLLGVGASKVVGAFQIPNFTLTLNDVDLRVGPSSGSYVGQGSIHFTVRVGRRIIYGGKLEVVAMPAAPTNLSAFTRSESDIYLTWDSVPTADSFKIERSTDGASWITEETVTGNQNSWIGSDYKPATDYYFRVTQIAKSGLSSKPSTTTKARTSSLSLGSPSQLGSSDRTANSFKLNFTHDGANLSEFEVQVRQPGGDWRTSENVPADRRSATIEFQYRDGPRLTPGSYEVRMRAKGSNTASTWSNTLSVQLDAPVPNAPSQLGSSDRTANSFKLNFTHDGANLSEFEVQVRQPGGDWRTSENVPADRRSATIEFQYRDGPRLTPGSYEVRMRAKGSNTASTWSNTLSVQLDAPVPNAPSRLRVETTGRNYVVLNWQDNSSGDRAESKFEVWVSRDGVNFSLSENVPVNSERARIDFEQRGGPSLRRNTRYWFLVIAVNEWGRTENIGGSINAKTLI